MKEFIISICYYLAGMTCFYLLKPPRLLSAFRRMLKKKITVVVVKCIYSVILHASKHGYSKIQLYLRRLRFTNISNQITTSHKVIIISPSLAARFTTEYLRALALIIKIL